MTQVSWEKSFGAFKQNLHHLIIINSQTTKCKMQIHYLSGLCQKGTGKCILGGEKKNFERNNKHRHSKWGLNNGSVMNHSCVGCVHFVWFFYA